MKTATVQTSPEFESAIAGRINTYYPGTRHEHEALTVAGLEIAREFLLGQLVSARGVSGCRGVIKRTKRLDTLRAIAYNLRQPAVGELRLSDGQPVENPTNITKEAK